MPRLVLAVIASLAAWLGFFLSAELIYVTPSGSAEFATSFLPWTTTLLWWALPFAVTKATGLLSPRFRGFSYAGLSAGAVVGFSAAALPDASAFTLFSLVPAWICGGIGAVGLAWVGSHANRWFIPPIGASGA